MPLTQDNCWVKSLQSFPFLSKNCADGNFITYLYVLSVGYEKAGRLSFPKTGHHITNIGQIKTNLWDYNVTGTMAMGSQEGTAFRRLKALSHDTAHIVTRAGTARSSISCHESRIETGGPCCKFIKNTQKISVFRRVNPYSKSQHLNESLTIEATTISGVFWIRGRMGHR